MIARPSATRCCWPPESCDGLRLSKRARPSRSAISRQPAIALVLRRPCARAGRTGCSRRPTGAGTARSDWNTIEMLRCDGGSRVTSRPADPDAALVGDLEPGDQAQRRRLAAARRAEQHVERALVELERDAVDGAHLAVGGRPVLARAFDGDRATCGRRAERVSRTARSSAAPGIGRAHERLADQERMDAAAAHQRDVARRDDAALGDHEPVGRHARQQVERRVERDVERLRRLRLLMPISGASTASARSSSCASWTSTSTSMPNSRARAASSARELRRRRAPPTISRIASAPSARDSATWYSSTMNSLRSTGSAHAARACDQVVVRALEELGVGEHRQAGRAGALVGRGDRARVERLAQHALARARALDLGDHGGRGSRAIVALERRGEAARRRRGARGGSELVVAGARAAPRSLPRPCRRRCARGCRSRLASIGQPPSRRASASPRRTRRASAARRRSRSPRARARCLRRSSRATSAAYSAAPAFSTTISRGVPVDVAERLEHHRLRLRRVGDLERRGATSSRCRSPPDGSRTRAPRRP